MAFDSDSWASPALQPPTNHEVVPRKGRRPSRYNTAISLEDMGATSRHRQSIAERRSRYDLARDITDVNPHSPRSLSPRITLTSPQESAAAPISAMDPLPEQAGSNSVSHDDTEPFLGPNAGGRNPGPRSSANREQSPRRSRLSLFHFGPYFPEAPVSQNGLPGTLPGAPQPSPENKPSGPNHLSSESASALQSWIEPPSRTRSILSRIAHPRSGSHLNNVEGYSMLKEIDQIDEGEQALVDLSTLGGGTLGLDFRRLPAPSDAAACRSDNDPGSHVSNHGIDTAGPKRAFVGAELFVNAPLDSAGSEYLSPSRRDDNDGRIARANTIRKIGQHLAEREQTIVAVTESPTVDLSLFEGTKRLSTDTLEGTLSRSTTFNPNNESFFYPADPEQPNWRPFSMGKPYIILLIVLSLGLAAIQEYFCQKSVLVAVNDVREMSLGAYFSWKYLPTLIFVAYGVLWQITDYETKRLEPYYQLSQPTGSIASTSLNLDYLSLWAFFVPLRALTYRHWAVFWGSTASLFATTVAPAIQNPSLTFVRNPHCPVLEDNCPDGQKKYVIQVDRVWSRLLSGSLGVVAVAGVLLYIQLRRKSGLLSDPKGIAGIASMATKSHILTDFQGMDEARSNEIHKRLKHHRYLLYKSTIWQGEYIRHSKPDRYAERRVGNPHPLILRLSTAVPFVTFLFVFLAIIPIINFTGANVVSTKLPWLIVLVATVIKQIWITLEFALRTIEPFYILSKGCAVPQETLTLDYRGTPYGLLPFQALARKHYIVALAGVGSVLADVLTVTVSSFSGNVKAVLEGKLPVGTRNDQTRLSVVISLSLSLAIVLFLIVSATLIYMRRRHPFLPREPSTIASVLAFIHQSRMLVDFVDTERLNNRQMEELFIAKGKRYGLGWFRGRDGKPHCAVDEEPMLSRYVHGVSYILATAPWEEI